MGWGYGISVLLVRTEEGVWVYGRIPASSSMIREFGQTPNYKNRTISHPYSIPPSGLYNISFNPYKKGEDSKHSMITSSLGYVWMTSDQMKDGSSTSHSTRSRVMLSDPLSSIHKRDSGIDDKGNLWPGLSEGLQGFPHVKNVSQVPNDCFIEWVTDFSVTTVKSMTVGEGFSVCDF